MVTSAGILPFRRSSAGAIEVLIVHPGGPFWSGKDEHAWSVAKGEFDGDENALVAAEREFEEEIGAPAPEGERLDLGEIRQSGGKLVHVWAVDVGAQVLEFVASNQFELEWPPRSGRTRHFPEVDRAEWMGLTRARTRLVTSQAAFLDRLVDLVEDR